MVRKPVVLITGASGEIGHGLIESLSRDGRRPIVTLDLKPLEPALGGLVQQQYAGSILDDNLLERILSEYEVDLVFHLAALLSTRGEFTPTTAHQVNVEGMLRMLEFAQKEGESHGRPVVFLYPSSIAAYGMPDLATKARAGKVKEDDWNVPTTMYGCNKLYCEHLGRYYQRHYKQLAAETLSGKVDFRCGALPRPHLGGDGALGRHLRLRAGDAARRRAGQALRLLRAPRHAHPVHGDARRRRRAAAAGRGPEGEADAHGLQRRGVQPLGRGDPRARRSRPSPGAEVTWAPHLKRQQIVDSWPADVDDSAARRDWGFAPRYDEARAFSEYLVPTIRERYR